MHLRTSRPHVPCRLDTSAPLGLPTVDFTPLHRSDCPSTTAPMHHDPPVPRRGRFAPLLLPYCAVRRCAAPSRCWSLLALPLLLALEPLRHSHPRMTCPAAPESSIHANPGTLAVSAENFVVA